MDGHKRIKYCIKYFLLWIKKRPKPSLNLFFRLLRNGHSVKIITTTSSSTIH